MTRDSIRLSLEMARHDCVKREMPVTVALLDEVLAALASPAEPPGLVDEPKWEYCPSCRKLGPLFSIGAIRSEETGGRHCAACFGRMPLSASRLQPMWSQPTPAAEPPGLVSLVREWQEARKPVPLSSPGVGVAESYQAAVKRMAAADEALAKFDLGASEDDEVETCETCQRPITGQVVRSWDDVSLCEECAEPDRNTSDALNASLAATAEIRKRERPVVGGGDFHMGGELRRAAASLREELAEIIRWRFRTADGAIMDGHKMLADAQRIADEIAPHIEEAVGER